MKKSTKWLLLVIIAFIPSFFVTRSETRYNASPCLYTEVCQEKTLGTKKIINYGFPASYGQSTEFIPIDSSKFGLVDQGGDKNYTLIIANILFWTLILDNLLMFLVKRRSGK